MRYIFCFLLLFSSFILSAQHIEVLDSGHHTSLRGLSVVNDHIIWVSGSNGQVGLSLDAGKTWEWITVKGFEKTDFRDIEAFSSTEAIIMGIAEPAYILKTNDAGKTWKVVYEDKRRGMFLDAMEFWNEMSGIVIGDPIDGKIFIARTFDGGDTWRGLPEENYPKADSGEAMFASSGTNVRAINKSEAVFVTGGLRSRLFVRNKKIDLPIIQGKQTTGANSIAVKNEKMMMVVGGDFSTKDSADKNCFISKDGGRHWYAPSVNPHGYRSCVEYIGKNHWICCGLNGVDYSTSDGKQWSLISNESFHAVRKAKSGKAVYLAGINGKIGKLVY
ncbi:MAG: oxidoreductase [Sphingobacteriales bacterium]|nr:oxidoreductase [Sphingobacteriales bacterium]MBI3719928.1 oxidoreductase [Sphingobacteriales bacterium]